MTDPPRADGALERRERELLLLHDVLLAANDGTDVSELLRTTLRRVCLHGNWPVGHVWLVAVNDPARLVSARIWHLSDTERFMALRLQVEQLDVVPSDDFVERVRATAAPLWVADQGGLFGRRLQNSVRTAVGAPLRAGAEVFGVLELLADVAVQPDESFLRIVSDIGMMLGRVVERARDAMHGAGAALEPLTADRAESLDAANRDLESFTYSVAHQLRGPLRAIDGFADILVDAYSDALDDKGRRSLGLIQANAERLGRLIDDLLLFSRLGREALTRRCIDPTPLVRDVLEQLAGEREGRTVDVVAGDLPPCYADPKLLMQVFTNLLSNAFKFTRPRAQARIQIGAYPGRCGSGRHVYYVRDNGVGFDMQHSHKLFGVFERLHREEEFEGTGVGLAIVQRIIERHGGQVWAAGQLEHGSTFYFSLPAGDAHG